MTAHSLIATLRELAVERGVTMLCTIHQASRALALGSVPLAPSNRPLHPSAPQPSSKVFSLFHGLILLQVPWGCRLGWGSARLRELLAWCS